MPTGTDVIGVFKCKFEISDENKESLFVVGIVGDLLKYWAYDITGDTLYELYEQEVEGDYTVDAIEVDVRNYPENGVDHLYITDNYHEVRQLTCSIPSPYVANYLTDYDLSLLRKGANGLIDAVVEDGGSLFSGTYQASYRMVDPVNRKFTKWSTLCNPVHVYKGNGADNELTHSGIGLTTDRFITFDITPSTAETDHFDYIQLAIVENILPTPQTTASLQDIIPVDGAQTEFQYKANTKIGTIPLTDITVDLAQIETVKTIAVKENRLFGGNISYVNLEADNGTPQITSGLVLKTTDNIIGDPVISFGDDNFSSIRKGYFRDEVYRFGIVYSDENGNNSPVFPLDLSAITDNTITSGLTDMKFPSRSYNNDYSILSNTGTGQVISLGLGLRDVINHPSWAVKATIVRQKRKKDIQFQTPVIPMVKVYGVGAIDRYPTRIIAGTSTETDVPGATPQTAGYVLAPRNFFWPELREIRKRPATTGTGGNYENQAETEIARVATYEFAQIFPQPNMYGDTPFVPTGGETLEWVDYALLKASYESFSDGSQPEGDKYKTNITGNFHALSDNQYFFDNAWVGKALNQSSPITDYEYFDNFGVSASVAGVSAMDYDALQTKGISFWQTPPTIQRSAVIKINEQTDLNYGSTPLSARTFAAATLNLVGGVGSPPITSASALAYDSSIAILPRYIVEAGSFVNGSSYTSAIGIANVRTGLGDDRYGDPNSFGEYFSTGAEHTFSEAEQATLRAGGTVNVDFNVWGGDCFISSNLFKVTDSWHSVINQSKGNGVTQDTGEVLDEKWGAHYRINNDSCNMSLTVPLEGVSQYVQVFLESEYNGQVRDFDSIQPTTSGINPIYLNDTKESIRTPLSYKYNINLNKENDQKIYVSKQQFSFEQHEYPARIVYSDIKIYNSDQIGFDIIRVGNAYDLEESRYGITKLAVASDRLYAIQEQGIVYIPTGERQIETSTGGTLAVNSGDVIGRVVIMDTIRGSQHLRGCIETGGSIYIPDNFNKGVYVISGGNLIDITKDNETEFRAEFATTHLPNSVVGAYDPVKKEFLLTIGNKTQIWNEKGAWVGDFEFGFQGGVYNNGSLFLLGNDSITTMYTGAVNTAFGSILAPRVVFCINPDDDIAKTFDNIMVGASDRLSSISFVIPRETSLGNQTASTSLDSTSIEGNYRIKIPRDSVGARLRGPRMLTTVTWKDVQSVLRNVFSYYRLSSKTPW